jgi:hypothetical protein
MCLVVSAVSGYLDQGHLNGTAHRWRYHPAMGLLEREAFSGSLESWLAAARNGEGCMVLVGGEARIGKTALVRAFCDRHGTDARVL